MTTEATPGALGSNDQLGLAPDRATMRLTLEDLGVLAQTAKRNGTTHAWQAVALEWCGKANAEIQRLRAALKKANDQAEHFERLWYLTNEDAARYAFAKTLEGQVVTMETFKSRGAAELDQALDDAMTEEAEAHGEPQSAVAAAYGGLVQTPQG